MRTAEFLDFWDDMKADYEDMLKAEEEVGLSAQGGVDDFVEWLKNNDALHQEMIDNAD